MKKFFTQLVASAAVICTIISCSVTAGATTVDDVAAVARQYGYPEDFIQQGYNMYYADPDKYTSEHFDQAIATIVNGGEALLQQYCPGYTTAPPSGGNDNQTVTTTVSTGNTSTQVTPSEKTDNSGQNGNTSSGESSFVRISEEDFINMSYDEKKAYIAGLSEKDRQTFMESLSAAELKSMMSQLPTDKKLEQVDTMAQVGEELGMNLSVDEITDDKISIQIKDDDGTLVGVAMAGVTVEDTGYDYRLLFSISGLLFIIAISGFVFVVRRCFGTNKNGAENEQ